MFFLILSWSQSFFQLIPRDTRSFDVCTWLIGSFRRYTHAVVYMSFTHGRNPAQPSESARIPTPCERIKRVKFKFHGRTGFVKNQFCVCNSNLSGESENTAPSSAASAAQRWWPHNRFTRGVFGFPFRQRPLRLNSPLSLSAQVGFNIRFLSPTDD